MGGGGELWGTVGRWRHRGLKRSVKTGILFKSRRPRVEDRIHDNKWKEWVLVADIILNESFNQRRLR